MSRELEALWDQIEDDLGLNNVNMRRDRPYDGQPHTFTGVRGKTEIKGITFRDLRDAFIRAICQSHDADLNHAHYDEAEKGEHAVLCENDVYNLKGDMDYMALQQNLSIEIEKLMGIYPNVPKLHEVNHE